ncbi:MAG TPA: polyprenyl synthetase family protein [Deltaproteobacteria bacterium]|nr:MAG: polyprenyl synthetase family protein [Deltaproteobacteria bacterium]HDM75523.1 polyprenyl synthetase family protein [Deltaproteobacteria bacterium]
MSFDLKIYLENKQKLVNAALERYLPPIQDPTRNLVDSMRYSLFAGGKRLRPILCLGAVETLGEDPELCLPVACALEMIHTYSLIHDDLPAMDDDDLRRGKPTNHKIFGEAMAILAGDGLLTEAFYLLSKFGLNDLIRPTKLIEIIKIISNAAGWRGMVGGQTIDMESEGKQIEPSLLELMHSCKTGALITASVESGAVAAGADEEKREALVNYGRHFGMAFQITDDLLDVTGNSEEMGKPAGSDEARNKSTFPALYGLEKTREMATFHVNKALEALEQFDDRATPLRELVKYLLKRRK